MRLAVLLVAAALTAAEFPLRLQSPAEVVAEIEPRPDSGEAVPLTLTLDGGAQQQVFVFRGVKPSVFLGALAAGEHRLETEAANVRFRELRPGDPGYDVVAHAPILYGRPNVAGRPSDMPLMAYCERLPDGVLQYTVIFSNEDGGTSTRALMARWGRTTDIEYIYRLEPSGRAIYQAKDHKDVEFAGAREGSHPVLYVATDNNMVADSGEPTVRYQLAPVLVDLSAHSREQVMDEHPWMYRVAAEELAREGKLRPYGRVDGEKISDPRNYLIVEMKVANAETAVAALVRRGADWVSSTLGRLDFAVSRDGWVRTTIEFPEAPAEIGFTCALLPDKKGDWPQARPCRIESVSKVFFLDRDYRPQPSLFSTGAFEIQPGVIRTFRLR